jgi:hypothetical protein
MVASILGHMLATASEAPLTKKTSSNESLNKEQNFEYEKRCLK